MTKNTLSIVIPTYGNKSRLELLLNSIFKAKIPESLAEIIVVENGQKFNAETICNRISHNVKVPITYLYLNEANLGKLEILEQKIHLVVGSSFSMMTYESMKIV